MENGGGKRPMRLGAFILRNMEAILATWEDFAAKEWQGALPGKEQLRDDAEAMLRALVEDMATPQNHDDQKLKSEGSRTGSPSGLGNAATGHALARVHDGFSVVQLVAEFRALRASVSRLWWASLPAPHPEQIEDMGRFNEAIDELVAGSVSAFAARVERSRQLFLGILAHDLRQPLSSIRMFTEFLAESDRFPDAFKPILSSMGTCCNSTLRMVGDLLDFTSTELGSAMPVQLAPANLEKVCREVVAEIQITDPHRQLRLEVEGDLNGEWDAARLKQMVSNLLSNSVHHGGPGQPITTILRATGNDVTMSVHNTGPPIPPDSLGVLFDPMIRVPAKDLGKPHGSIGLGLFICRQIAIAHGGRIDVESDATAGTTFTVTLPKRAKRQRLHESD